MKTIFVLLLALFTPTIITFRVPAAPHHPSNQRRLLSVPLPDILQTSCAKNQKLCTASTDETLCADRYATCCEWTIKDVTTAFTCPSDHPRCCSPDLTNLGQMMCGDSEQDNCLGGDTAGTLRSEKQEWSLKKVG